MGNVKFVNFKELLVTNKLDVSVYDITGQLVIMLTDRDGERAAESFDASEVVNLRDALNTYILSQSSQTTHQVYLAEKARRNQVDIQAQVEHSNHSNLVDRRVAVNDAQLPVKTFFGLPPAVTLSEREATGASRSTWQETLENNLRTQPN
jgi:hypothetical protein